MTCGERKIQISCWLDGALAEPERRLLEIHLESCPACSRFLSEQRELAALLSDQDSQLQLPHDLWQRIESRIAPAASPMVFEPGRAAWWRQEWSYALAASLLLILLSGSLFLGSERIDTRQLAELDRFQVRVDGNPFLSEPERTNPFFDLPGAEANPFSPTRSP